MPTYYKRKSNSTRGSWTEQSLQSAIDAVESGSMGVNAAARQFEIPASTLRRRLKQNNSKKVPMGPASSLGEEIENKLVNHIKKLQKYGFAPTRSMVRTMAFRIAEQFNIKTAFNAEKKTSR